MSAHPEPEPEVRPTAEVEAREMLAYLAELYGIPEENLSRAVLWIGIRSLFECETLLAQVREGDGWLTVADTLCEGPKPKPWRRRDEGS